MQHPGAHKEALGCRRYKHYSDAELATTPEQTGCSKMQFGPVQTLGVAGGWRLQVRVEAAGTLSVHADAAWQVSALPDTDSKDHPRAPQL